MFRGVASEGIRESPGRTCLGGGCWTAGWWRRGRWTGEGAGDPGRKDSEEAVRRRGSDFLQGGLGTRGLDDEQGSAGLRRQVRI